MDKYAWKEVAKQYQPVGPRVTCNPPPMDTDEDWVVLDFDGVVSDFLNGSNWEDCGEDYDGEDDGEVSIYRLDDVNVLCMHSQDQYDKFILATRIAKGLNLMDKADRVNLFEAIRYGRGFPEL